MFPGIFTIYLVIAFLVIFAIWVGLMRRRQAGAGQALIWALVTWAALAVVSYFLYLRLLGMFLTR